MTLQEIADRLKKEFPGIYVKFQASAQTGLDTFPPTELQIYSEKTGWFDCTSPQDGINKVRNSIAIANPASSAHDVHEAHAPQPQTQEQPTI